MARRLAQPLQVRAASPAGGARLATAGGRPRTPARRLHLAFAEALRLAAHWLAAVGPAEKDLAGTPALAAALPALRFGTLRLRPPRGDLVQGVRAMAFSDPHSLPRLHVRHGQVPLQE